MAAASHKSIPIALLVVFATVVALNLQQAAAVRAEGAATKAHVAAPAPSPRVAPIHLKGGMFSDFPCFPFLPKIVRDLCHAIFDPSPPPPKPERGCRSALKEMVPSCTGFLTNSSVPEPPQKACCDEVQSIHSNPTTMFCLCHVANGNIGKLLPAPLNQSRAITVLSECDIGLNDVRLPSSASIIANFAIPPMDPTAPPPEDSDEKKA